MSGAKKQVGPVKEQSKFEGVFHVNVDKTVERIKQSLAENQQVELVSRQSEISRVGMVMRRVEEEVKCRIVSMKTNYETVVEKEQ